MLLEGPGEIQINPNLTHLCTSILLPKQCKPLKIDLNLKIFYKQYFFINSIYSRQCSQGRVKKKIPILTSLTAAIMHSCLQSVNQVKIYFNLIIFSLTIFSSQRRCIRDGTCRSQTKKQNQFSLRSVVNFCNRTETVHNH